MKIKMLSKKDRVGSWLKGGRTITQRDAIQNFNAYRLADIIFKLKQDGMNIINMRRSGHAKYKLVEPGKTITMEL